MALQNWILGRQFLENVHTNYITYGKQIYLLSVNEKNPNFQVKKSLKSLQWPP